MAQAFVGFYWTLPVPHRGYRSLPTDVEAAAKRSRTIRYQLEVIRRYVREEKGTLVGETAFIELASDRATKAVDDALAKVATLCAAHEATLLYVDFSRVHAWRPHTAMTFYLEEHQVEALPLLPDPALIDGRTFDPAKHFRTWRQRHGAETRALRVKADVELAAAVDGLPDGDGRHSAAADELNRRGVKTGTGRNWTSEGVRKAYRRLQLKDPATD